MSSPKVSVVMTCYNTSEYLPAAIDSLIAQSFQDWELLVADDGSTDDSKAIVDQYASKDARIVASHNTVNLHYLKTRNRLFGLAKGQYITFLDSDDILHKDRIAKQFQFMEQHLDVALCGCQVQHIDEKGEFINSKSLLKPTSYEEIKQAFPEYNPITGPTIFVRSEVLREFGGYREFFSGLCSEDFDLVSRIVEKYRCVNLDEKLYYYRQFDASTSRVRELSNPRKFFSHQIVQRLIIQRQQGQNDDIEKGAINEIDHYVSELAEPYKRDKSLVYIDQVTSNLYVDLKAKALISSMKAVVANPWKLYNYKTLKYCAIQLLKS